MRKTLAKHRVAMAVQPGAPIFELSVPCEVFGTDRPEIHDPWYDFEVCPTEPATEVAAGFVANQNGSMDDLARADTVIIIGCTNIRAQPPTQLIDAIRHAYRRHARIVGICSGAFVLAHAGLLDHRRATTHWMHIDDFATLFPAVILDPSVLYVEDGGVFTSAGTAAAIDLCLELVRQDLGAAAANEVARRMVIPAASRRRPSPVPAMAHATSTPTTTWPRPCNGPRPTSTATSPSKTSPDGPTSAGGRSSDASTTPSA